MASGNDVRQDGARAGSGQQQILRVEELSIGFGGREVVHGISFEIAAGQTLGLVGESGSGKSATALAAMRLLPAQASVGGRIWFYEPTSQKRDVGHQASTTADSSATLRNDKQTTIASAPTTAVDLLALPEREMRRRRGSDMAMIFQEPMTALNPVMRVGAQIAEAVRAHHPGLSSKAVDRLVLDAMREVALPEPERRARDYPHQFSGGQRQRILIAMAIVNRPRLLIADEPTTALDVTVQAQILELLKELRRAHGLSMLFISHDLAVVAEACDQPGDRVAVMRQGRIVEQAETRELFANPQHAYTRRLLASAPTMATDRTRPLAWLAKES
jgi:peptide/nickel transport system ATP-binding protein